MICPNCKCEYISGVTRCADCDVALIDALDSPPSSTMPVGDDAIVQIWTGNGLREFATVKAALEQAQIHYVAPGADSYFIFPSLRPKMQIGVCFADRDKAKKVLEELDVQDDDSELSPDERERIELPDADAVDSGDDAKSAPDDLPEDWEDQDGATEIWSGADEELADMLTACFRENGIASRKIIEAGRWRILIPHELEARAKEIVREVVEAAPPE